MSKKPSPFAQSLQKTAQKLENQEPAAQQEATVKTSFTHPEPEQLVQMNVRVTPELKEETRIYCAVTGMSHQELVSAAIKEFMQRHPSSR